IFLPFELEFPEVASTSGSLPPWYEILLSAQVGRIYLRPVVGIVGIPHELSESLIALPQFVWICDHAGMFSSMRDSM
ncbi:hypothetical protein GP486_008881, partial [Trichoglossum hirsutum]